MLLGVEILVIFGGVYTSVDHDMGVAPWSFGCCKLQFHCVVIEDFIIWESVVYANGSFVFLELGFLYGNNGWLVM